MYPKDFSRNKPEEKIEMQLKAYLKARGWFVKKLQGNKYQSGLPDLWCTHIKLGQRFIEVKLPGMVGSRFTKAQLEEFPKMIEHGQPIWILTAANETEYNKLFDKKGNFHEYLVQTMWKS